VSSFIKPIEDRRLLGISMVLFTLFLFTGIDTSAKWLALAGLPTAVIIFVRFAVHLVLIVAIAVPAQGVAVFRSNNLKLEVLRSLLLLSATALNFTAIRYLPLTVTAAIMFSMPIVMAALSGPLLGEHVGWRRWAAIIVGFIGVLIIIRPGGNALHWSVVLMIGVTISFTLHNILTRKLAGVDSAYTQQIYSALLPTLCAAPFAFSDWAWPSGSVAWTAFLAMGIFGGIGHLVFSMAHRLAPASTLAPFVYPQIFLMSISSWLVFAEPPDLPVFIGATIVVGSGLYIWLRERQASTGPGAPGSGM
jgi:drug/metabolite transporter (DMT)-like permease